MRGRLDRLPFLWFIIASNKLVLSARETDGRLILTDNIPRRSDNNESDDIVVRRLSDETDIVNSYIHAYYYPEEGQSNTRFGESVTQVGDVNEDGTVDMAIGTPHYGTKNEGMVVLMMLMQNGLWSDYGLIYASDLGLEKTERAQIGRALTVIKTHYAEDDGRVLLAISSKGQTKESQYFEGCVHLVYVSHSSETRTEVELHSRFSGSDFGVNASHTPDFGRSVLGVGDWDRDGADIDDLLVGAPGFLSGCIFLLSPLRVYPLIDSIPAHICGADIDPMQLQSGARFGASLALVHNNTIVVGATSTSTIGSVYICTLSGDLNIESVIKLQTSSLGITIGDFFGASVATLFPHDLDGIPDTLDIAVGAPRMDDPNVSVFVLLQTYFQF